MSHTADRIDRHIGDRIRRRRKLLGIAPTATAQAIGVTFQQLQKYETGQNKVSAARLHLVAASLGVDVGWFYEGLPATNGHAETEEEAAIREFVASGPGLRIIRRLAGLNQAELRFVSGVVAELPSLRLPDPPPSPDT